MEKEISKIVESFENPEEKSSLWSKIPIEIACMILSHLPGKDHITFRATCKSWKSATLFHSEHKAPLLLFLKGDQYYLFNLIDNTYHISIQQPPIVNILYSNFGWLLMGASLDIDPTIFFFDVLTNVRIDLPDLPCTSFPISKFSFSSSPTSSDCIVVGVRIMYTHVLICLTKPGENYWTIIEETDLIRSGKDFLMSECSPIFYNGQCFCLDVNGYVAIFDPKNPKDTWRNCGGLFSRRSKTRQAFMVESDGQLLAVAISREEGRICVYRLHSSNMYWIKISDLGNKILYLSNNGTWADTTSFRGMRNKIYFPKFQDGSMVFYSLDTGKYHSYEDKFWSNNAYNLSELMYSAWIKPMF